jgi:hypothetical protein
MLKEMKLNLMVCFLHKALSLCFLVKVTKQSLGGTVSSCLEIEKAASI